MKKLKVYPKHPNLLPAGTLSGDKVINPDGEDLGKGRGCESLKKISKFESTQHNS